ncbi:amidase [Leucobacter sp. W1478]|uniref:amidase n=1 Tax=Leucobacter sp. W1478 TaxID=3439065 RepID=UPI003F3091F0
MPVSEPTALELRDALRRREITATGLAESALARVEERPELGAFVSVSAELALADAARADALIHAVADPRDLPPLTGLPTAHKDLIDVRGFVTTHGSRAVPHRLAQADDPIATAVRAAGAITIGKTQVPEFGIAGYSENAVAPPAANPFDTSLTAGGSSGGTAAAVAAGLIPAAIGSDAGGSIRIPAAACGLVGLKPGRGVVPADRLRGATDPAGAPTMGVSGPIARTARDAALFLDAILGGHGELTLAAVNRAEELRGLRVGVSFASPFEEWIEIGFSPEAHAAVAAGAAALEAAGHHVEAAAIHYEPQYPEAFTTVWTAGLGRIDFAPGAEALLGDLARMFLERARRTSPEALGIAVEGLHSFAASASRQWAQYDVVLTPALATLPPALGAFTARGPEGDYRLQCQWAPQTSMVNVAGHPAATAPTHWTATGLPMGVQLIGRPGSEAQLLQLAEQLSG